MQAPKEMILSVLRRKKDFSQGVSTMPPNTPAMGAERTAADLQATASAAELLELDDSMIR